MATLNDIYIVCACGGFLYLVGTAVLGFANADSGGGDGGDSSGGDAGGIDAGDASGAGDAGGIDAGDAGGDLSGIDVSGDIRHLQHIGRSTGLAHAGTTHANRRRKVHIGLLLLKMTSPYTVACFAFFFGLVGLLATRYTPFGLLTLAPATIAGIAGYKAMTAMMNNLADKLYASSTHKEEDVIGTVGELTIPIQPGRTGEIIYLNGQTRHTAPAKAKDPTQDLAKSSKVMIADIIDGVFIVEPYNDIVLDDSITIPQQKLRNS